MYFNRTHKYYMLPKTVTWHMNFLQEKAKLIKVIDGANAPKITGKSWYKSLKYSHYPGLKDPTSESAVYFGLSLTQ